MIKNIFLNYLQRFVAFSLIIYVGTGFRFYIKRWQIHNYPKLGRRDPVIYVSNHQNAFLDAFAIVFSQSKQPIFLTRANIFSNPIARFFLRTLNMFPVYRQRDGGDTVKRNEGVMQDCIDVLSDGRQPISIFVEGNHSMKRSLRPFKKGAVRIAFLALEQMNFKKELKIIPMGLNYSKHTRSRSDVLVNFGDPLIVNDYKTLYEENPNKAFTEITNELNSRVKKLIINISDKENYEEIEKAWIMEKKSYPSLIDELHNDQKIIARLTQEKVEGKTLKTTYTKKKKPILGWIVGFPAFVYGLMNHLAFLFLMNKFLGKLVSDIHFYGSMKIAGGLFLGVFFYFLQATGVYSLSGGNLLITSIYFVTLPFFGIFANDYYLKYYSDDPQTSSSAELLRGYK